MQEWYRGITRGQKIFLYLVSVFLVLFWGVGLIPLACLVYCSLGKSE